MLSCVARADLQKVVFLAWGWLFGLGLLGLLAFERPSMEMLGAFDLRDMRVTVPSLVAGGLLVATAGACLLFDTPRHPAAAAARVLAAGLFALIGLDQLGRLHERVAAATGAAPAWALGTLIAGLAACALATAFVRGPPRYLLWAGAAEWAGAHATSALALRSSSWLAVAEQVFGVIASVLISLALFTELQRHLRRRAPGEWRQDTLSAALAALRSLALWRVAVVLASCSAALFVLGWLVSVEGVSLELLDPHGELGLPAWFDATMLATAAGLVVLLRWLDEDRRARRQGWLMAAVFVDLAVDEIFSIHETIGGRLGLAGEGQLVLAPVVLAAGAAWLLTLRRLWPVPAARTLFIAGALVWVISQTIDMVYGGLRAETAASVVFEDALEGWGSALFVLGLLAAVQATRRVSEGTRPPEPPTAWTDNSTARRAVSRFHA